MPRLSVCTCIHGKKVSRRHDKNCTLINSIYFGDTLFCKSTPNCGDLTVEQVLYTVNVIVYGSFS